MAGHDAQMGLHSRVARVRKSYEHETQWGKIIIGVVFVAIAGIVLRLLIWG